MLARESRVTRAPADARATLRRPVKLRARLRDRAASKFEVTVLDLSLTGFRGQTSYPLRPGTLVWITLPGLSSLEAHIAWQRLGEFGAHFAQPLHAAVFEHVCDLGR